MPCSLRYDFARFGASESRIDTMFSDSPPIVSYSSDVALTMIIDGQAVGLAKIGPKSVTPTTPIDADPCEASVVMKVDGRTHRWTVRLTHGAVPFESDIATQILSHDVTE